MTLVFIDYTPLYFTAIARTPVPPVMGGKFVQIRNDETEYLVFSPQEFTKYHAGIVERFCLDKGIEGAMLPRGSDTRFMTKRGLSSAEGNSRSTEAG